MFTRININFLKISFVFILLILQFGFIFSDFHGETCIRNDIGEIGECNDLGELLGLEKGKFFGSGLDISNEGFLTFLSDESVIVINQGKDNEIYLQGNKGVQIGENLNEINFFEKGGKTIINGDVFENITKGSTITLDHLTGKISEIDLTTNEKGGTFFVEGAKIDIKPDSTFSYKNGIFYFPEHSEITNPDYEKSYKLKGKEVKLPDENIVFNTKKEGISTFKTDENGYVEEIHLNDAQVDFRSEYLSIKVLSQNDNEFYLRTFDKNLNLETSDFEKPTSILFNLDEGKISSLESTFTFPSKTIIPVGRENFITPVSSDSKITLISKTKFDLYSILERHERVEESDHEEMESRFGELIEQSEKSEGLQEEISFSFLNSFKLNPETTINVGVTCNPFDDELEGSCFTEIIREGKGLEYSMGFYTSLSDFEEYLVGFTLGIPF